MEVAATADDIVLGPDEFAFYFDTNEGVDASALANLLKRTATVARQHGGELRVIGLRQGSLAVVMKAIGKSKLGQGAAKEFSEKPIDTSIKLSTVAAGIVGAIIWAMSPAQSGSTPLAKAAAELVEKQKVAQITIVTGATCTVVMNQSIAAQIRAAEKGAHTMLPRPEIPKQLSPPVARMIDDARQGDLSGDAALVGEELHFRPDGFRYWVPVDMDSLRIREQLFPGRRFRISGHIATRGGQPDRIVIDQARPID